MFVPQGILNVKYFPVLFYATICVFSAFIPGGNVIVLFKGKHYSSFSYWLRHHYKLCIVVSSLCLMAGLGSGLAVRLNKSPLLFSCFIGGDKCLQKLKESTFSPLDTEC